MRSTLNILFISRWFIFIIKMDLFSSLKKHPGAKFERGDIIKGRNVLSRTQRAQVSNTPIRNWRLSSIEAANAVFRIIFLGLFPSSDTPLGNSNTGMAGNLDTLNPLTTPLLELQFRGASGFPFNEKTISRSSWDLVTSINYLAGKVVPNSPCILTSIQSIAPMDRLVSERRMSLILIK